MLSKQSQALQMRFNKLNHVKIGKKADPFELADSPMKIKDSEKRNVEIITVDYFRPENQPQAQRAKRNDFGQVLGNDF